MDQHGEKEEWGASEQWISTGGREQRAEGRGVVDQRLELLGIAPHVAMGFPNPAQEREIRIRQMLEVERAQHHLYMMRRGAYIRRAPSESLASAFARLGLAGQALEQGGKGIRNLFAHHAANQSAERTTNLDRLAECCFARGAPRDFADKREPG